RCQAQTGLKAFDQGAECRAESEAPLIFHPAIFDTEAVIPLAIALRVPAEMGLDTTHFHRSRWCQRAPDVAAEHFAKLLHTPIVNEILNPRPLPIGPVTVITKEPHHGLGRTHHRSGR